MKLSRKTATLPNMSNIPSSLCMIHTVKTHTQLVYYEKTAISASVPAATSNN